MKVRIAAVMLESDRGETAVEAAFNLIEVIAALAIFAVGIVALVGLFGAWLRPLAEMEDEAVAAGLMVPLRLELERRARETNSLAPVRALILTPAAASGPSGEGDPFLVAPRSGAFVASANDERWATGWGPPYFVIRLYRNSSLPYGSDTDLPECVTYTAEVRWPGFVAGNSAEGSAPRVAAASTAQSHLRLQGAVSP